MCIRLSTYPLWLTPLCSNQWHGLRSIKRKFFFTIEICPCACPSCPLLWIEKKTQKCLSLRKYYLQWLFVVWLTPRVLLLFHRRRMKTVVCQTPQRQIRFLANVADSSHRDLHQGLESLLEPMHRADIFPGRFESFFLADDLVSTAVVDKYFL